MLFLYKNKTPKKSPTARIDRIDDTVVSIPLIPLSYEIEKQEYIREKRYSIEHEKKNIYHSEVPISNLPEEFNGFQILQLSDIHFTGTEKDADVLRYLATLSSKITSPDMIVLTGDIIQDSYKELTPRIKQALASFFPNVPKYFVLGNHDYLEKGGSEPQKNNPEKNIIPFLESIGYKNLTNQTQKIQRNGAEVTLGGLDDFLEGSPHMPMLDSNNINILITHELDGVPKKALSFLDLILSGHTHGGEIDMVFYDGYKHLKRQKTFFDYHNQRTQWKMLTSRTASHVNPGLHTENPLKKRLNTDKEGASLLTLRSFRSQLLAEQKN